MTKDTIITKRKLSIIFTIMVFIVVFLLWITFFFVKYFKQLDLEENEFSTIVRQVETWKLSVDKIINFWNDIGRDLVNKNFKKNDFDFPTPPIIDEDDLKPKWFINYVLVDNKNTVISSNIKDDISDKLIESINKNDSFYQITQSSGFLIKKFDLADNKWTFIILKWLRYSLRELLEDSIAFLFISLLFSIILYFIAKKFVDKTFVPVEENMKDMKNFIHNAWHELKTPISVIDSNIQIIDDLKVYDKEMISELKKEVRRLNSIIDSLIKLSDIALFKDLEDINLRDTVDEIIKEFSFNILKKKIDVKVDITNDVIVKSSNDYLYMFLLNLIWNAIKYNKDSWSINIFYKNWELFIKDTGIWIDRKDVDKIFDRFFKADKSRNSEWFGIWLSLVKKIADVYKWKIRVESELEKGTTFIVRF